MPIHEGWLSAARLHLNRARQSRADHEHEAIVAPLSAGQAIGNRMLAQREALFSAAHINPSEKKAAGHWALRRAAVIGQGPHDSTHRFAPAGQDDLLPAMQATHERCRAFADAIRLGKRLGSSKQKFDSVIHLGIGGSDTGPQLLIEALRDEGKAQNIQSRFVSNLDYHGMHRALAGLNPQSTLIVVASKSFTTEETMANARHLLEWLREQGLPAPIEHLVAITSNEKEALAWGIGPERIFPFDQSVGGRYSIWGPVSLIARIVLGNKVVDDFIAGAIAMDDHFRSAPLSQNMPAILAVTDFYNLRQRRLPTLMVSAYDSRLSLLVPYLKQLWMESLGKQTDLHGRPLAAPACPILWGDVGTNAQHAFFQLLHQGMQGVAVELIGVIGADHAQHEHHKKLLSHLIAQWQALSLGQTSDQEPELNCAGGHPVNLLMMDRLDAPGLGALIALWEHRVLCMAACSDINPFDQWGVELGKRIAQAIGRLFGLGPEKNAGLLEGDALSRGAVDWILKQGKSAPGRPKS